MLNNKGFAVSTVLYTLLIAFLMFLGAALAQFSSSSSLIGKANDDIINGTKFEVMQVEGVNGCDDGIWYNDTNAIVRIKSKYGTVYWPKDFYEYNLSNGEIGAAINSISKDNYTYSENKNIGVICSYDKINWQSCQNFNIASSQNELKDDGAYFYIKVFDNKLSGPALEEDGNTIIKGLYNICE